MSNFRNLLSVHVAMPTLAAFIAQQSLLLLGDAHPTPFPNDVRYV